MRTNHILALLAIVGGVAAAFTNYSEKIDLYPDWKFKKERMEGHGIRFISAPHLADLVFSKDQNLLLFDTREWKDYENYHIPLALQYDRELVSKAGIKPGIIVLYGEEGNAAIDALARDLPGRVYLLEGGLEAWNSLVLFPDFMKVHVRNSDQVDHILRRSGFFGGKPLNTQVLNINVKEDRYREGC
jgi:rhodanese-related sulfurtransferase